MIPPEYAAEIWPNRSLPRSGFRMVLCAVAAGLAVPAFAVTGTVAFWILVPFLLITLAALWIAFELSYRSGDLREFLTLREGRLTVRRVEPNGDVREWQADPTRVQVRVRDTWRLEKYLSLSSEGRTIELGAFLSPGERDALGARLRRKLGAYRSS